MGSVPTIYLAGPIYGTSYAKAIGWRQQVTAALAPDIQCYSPMRGKAYLSQEQLIADHYQEVLSTMKGITTRDRFDVMRCDLVLANLLGAERVSIGTVMEIAWADLLHKPIVLAMEGASNPHWHGMIREVAGFIAPSLEEAVTVARQVLLP